MLPLLHANGTNAVVLEATPLAVAFLLVYLGKRLKRLVGIRRPKLAKVSKYTLYSLAGLFFVFAVWAFLGFSYPFDPVSIALNDTGKILSFVAAITLFLGEKTQPGCLSVW